MLTIRSFNSADQKVSSSIKKFDTAVYDQIMRFLRGHARESENTSSAYERDIRQFFSIVRKKDIEYLNKNDLVFTMDELDDYQSYLIDTLKVSFSTSNRHITSISGCMKYLYRRGLVKDILFLDINKPTSHPNSYDGFTGEEIEKISNFVLTTGREKTSQIKRMLIRFSYDTCMRLEECLNLKWFDFGDIGNDNMIPVRTVAKGNKVMNRKISVNLYNELLTLSEDNGDKVFNIGTATVSRMMGDIREYLNIDSKRRRIVFHSIRKAGAQFIWESTRDINQVSRALGHESIQTTELYINKNEDYGVVGALSSAQDLNATLFKEVTHSELLEAIHALGKDKQMFINLKLRQIIEK